MLMVLFVPYKVLMFYWHTVSRWNFSFQTAKNEVNVPVLKNLVDTLYTPVVDMTMKKKHTFVS